MKNERRKSNRYKIKFSIFSNEIIGVATNLSRDGVGFYTNDEFVPAEDIPFKAEINIDKIDNENYIIKGKGRLLYSIKNQEGLYSYYNGFQFTELEKESEKIISDILKKTTDNNK